VRDFRKLLPDTSSAKTSESASLFTYILVEPIGRVLLGVCKILEKNF
jgi:hypothetical protein